MLRPYQLNSVSQLREAYRKHLRVLLVMPTGSGKTVVFSQICASAIERGKCTLILTDRTEIFSQTIKTMANHEIPVCRIDASNRSIATGANLFIGMVESFKRRMSKFAEAAVKFDLIIVDEAHKNAYNKVFEAYPEVKALGCTATPVSKTLHKYYTEMVCPVDIPELIQDGFLATCRGFEMQDDFSDLVKDSAGEFTEQSQFSHFNNTKLYTGLIEQYIARCADRKTLIFCVNIEHVTNTVAAFMEAGIKAHGITSETKKEEREWILREFRGGSFPVLVNANILIAGYDEPSIDCIIVNRATSSLPLWLQAAGRGSRPHPGKENFLLIDFGGNFTRHGLWNEPRAWSLDPPKKRSRTLGAAPIKTCKICESLVPAQARVCEFCGHVFEPTAAELASGKLIEVTNQRRAAIEGKYISELTIPELIELERTKLAKASYIWRVIRAKGADHITAYAKIRGYKDGWLYRQLETLHEETLGGAKVQFADKKIKNVPTLNC